VLKAVATVHIGFRMQKISFNFGFSKSPAGSSTVTYFYTLGWIGRLPPLSIFFFSIFKRITQKVYWRSNCRLPKLYVFCSHNQVPVSTLSQLRLTPITRKTSVPTAQ